MLTIRVKYVPSMFAHVCCDSSVLLCLGEKVQLWHDKASDSEWPGIDDVFPELPDIISGVG
jgi:hypothetical protein